MSREGRGGRRGAGLKLLLAAAAAAAVLLPAALRAFAALRAPDELYVLRYGRIGGGAGAVAPDLFYLQMRDLVDGAFSPVSPARIRARVRWGRTLPERAVLFSIGDVSPEAATAVADALAEYGFSALVGPETAAAEGIGLSGAAGAAKIGGGRRGDPLLALPCLEAVPGPLAFSVSVARDSKTPDFFGTLRVAQPVGVRFPASVVAYRPQDGAPFVQADAPALPADGFFALPLPAGAEFPLDVAIYDTERVLLYHSVSIPRSAVETPEGWRRPVGGPESEVKFDGLD